jgi:hypothetical protein
MGKKTLFSTTPVRWTRRGVRGESARKGVNAGDLRISRFESQGPQIFRLGELVEAQISFIVVPLKGDTVKMHTVLHAIVLLNGEFSKVRQHENER